MDCCDQVGTKATTLEDEELLLIRCVIFAQKEYPLVHFREGGLGEAYQATIILPPKSTDTFNQCYQNEDADYGEGECD